MASKKVSRNAEVEIAHDINDLYRDALHFCVFVFVPFLSLSFGDIFVVVVVVSCRFCSD